MSSSSSEENENVVYDSSSDEEAYAAGGGMSILDKLKSGSKPLTAMEKFKQMEEGLLLCCAVYTFSCVL